MSEFDCERIAEGLPARNLIPQIAATMQDTNGGARLVVVAPPGSGKTTVVPPVIANAVSGRVVVTQPRRVAAKAAAARLAHLTQTSIGQCSGYSVRGERKTSAATRVEFVTDGLLVRRLMHDPDLTGVGAVILDEIHERSLDSDLLAGMLSELAQLRDDLTIVAMSATIDAERWQQHFDATVLHAEAVLHPLEITWCPPTSPRLNERGVTREFLDHVSNVTATAAANAGAGERVLTFVPGAREAAEVASRLATRGISAAELTGTMSLRAQDAVLAPSSHAQVIVATAVAESSLTVPGVRTVVDSGLARQPAMDFARGLSSLVTVPASRASATQRAGRAGRLGPGRVFRCFSEASWGTLAAHPAPEIATADLSEFVLQLAVWSGAEPDFAILPEMPPAAAITSAVDQLEALGALCDHRITSTGRELAEVPAPPRFARALIDGAKRLPATVIAEIVAMLVSSERAPSGDLATLLTRLRRGDLPAASRWRDDTKRFLSTLRDQSGESRVDRNERDSGQTTAQDAEIATAVALAFPERLATARGATGDYLMTSGTGARLPNNSPLIGQPWLAIAELTGRSSGAAQIRAAVPIDQQLALELASPLVTEKTEIIWSGGRIRAQQVRRLGDIQLAATPVAASHDLVRQAVVERLKREGLGVLNWSDAALAFRRRLAFLHRHLGDPWPDVSDQGLLHHLDAWFAPELDQLASGASLDRVAVHPALQRLLPWPEAARLEELAPERLEVPSGSTIAVTYPEIDSDAQPILAVKLQECFGMHEAPRIADGRVSVVLHLLSPARRPLAVTADLASFWAGPYAQVRAEMRGRYPKHPWPDDPLTALAKRGTKKSGR